MLVVVTNNVDCKIVLLIILACMLSGMILSLEGQSHTSFNLGVQLG